MKRISLYRRAGAVALLSGIVVSGTACGEVARTGRAPVLLIIEALEADSGADDEETFSSVLMSDVQTIVEVQEGGQTLRIPTIFNDSGRVRMRLALKNPGSQIAPLGPSTLNEVTLNRYRVDFRRTDGRGTPGVDVPYGFEGGMTVTVCSCGSATEGIFDMVRHSTKSEPPLKNLVGGAAGRFINTVAEVTFYGRDQAGNEVTASGLVTVNFADFGDPR
jgi:hypothetical protein